MRIYQSKRQGIFYTGITSILKTTYPTWTIEARSTSISCKHKCYLIKMHQILYFRSQYTKLTFTYCWSAGEAWMRPSLINNSAYSSIWSNLKIILCKISSWLNSFQFWKSEGSWIWNKPVYIINHESSTLLEPFFWLICHPVYPLNHLYHNDQLDEFIFYHILRKA